VLMRGTFGCSTSRRRHHCVFSGNARGLVSFCRSFS